MCNILIFINYDIKDPEHLSFVYLNSKRFKNYKKLKNIVTRFVINKI